jgi:predicted Na+-dependent transporter
MTLLLGFAMGQVRVGALTNHLSHFVGLLLGCVLGMVFAKFKPSRARRSELWLNVAAAAGLLACVASLVLSQLSPRWQGQPRSSWPSSTTLPMNSDR